MPTGTPTAKGIPTFADTDSPDLGANGLGEILTAIDTLAMPTGTVLPYAGATAPSGYLLCDGSAVSRTTFATLFNLIGTTYGAGDGTTTFNLPDLQGRVPVGKGSNPDTAVLSGNEGLANANRSPKHNSTNNLTLPTHKHVTLDGPGILGIVSLNNSGAGGGGQSDVGSTADLSTEATSAPQTFPAIDGSIGPGGSRPTDTPAYLVLNYIVKT